MFDIDSGKLLIVAVLALIVIGPKELPRVLRQVGQAVGKMRRMAGEFQGQFMDAMKEADIADIRKELDAINKSAALDVHFDPARDIQAELTSAMTPTAAATVSDVSVASDAALTSPVEGFALPQQSETDLGEEALAIGIAPVAEMPLEDGQALGGVMHANGAAQADERTSPKRKVFVKRRSSPFNLVHAEDKAIASGEPLTVRRRLVRPKSNDSHGVQSS